MTNKYDVVIIGGGHAVRSTPLTWRARVNACGARTAPRAFAAVTEEALPSNTTGLFVRRLAPAAGIIRELICRAAGLRSCRWMAPHANAQR